MSTIRPLRSAVACLIVLALVVASAALAARGDPQKNINPADQARAKQMLLRKADFPATFETTPSSESSDPYCRALDESDLTLTGESRSAAFRPRQAIQGGGLLAVLSGGQVYESVADANASWRRGTGAAGVACQRDIVRRQIEKDGDRFVSFQRVPFARLAERAAAFRLVAETRGATIRVDFVVFMQSRGQASFFVAALPTPTAKAERQRLARIVARRLKSAMRGA